MIAAIYARKSTEQNGVSDDGISGAEFVKRPGFLRLLNALSRRPPFQILIMSEESRLGRESIETGWTLKKIIDAGVRVFYYLEDRERTLDSAMDKVMMHLSNFAGEVEREKTRQRTRDAVVRKLRPGRSRDRRLHRAAKALGLTIPQSVLLRADQVIQ